MCGIVGFFGQGDRALLEAMNGAIVHRGPDEGGLRLDGPAGLAMRRLAIIDVEGGHQPLGNAAGSVWIVFNGEVYNYRELRQAHLASRPFASASDTEVVLGLYEAYGEAAFGMLNGMYALALWDARCQTMYLVRDRMGIKPLYYHHGPARLSFASELKGLLQDPAVPRRLDPDALAAYMTWQYVPGPATMLADVRKLPPGHFLKLRPEQAPQLSAYWQPAYPSVREARPEEFGALFGRAVRRQLVSDVPVGAFLSGGIDSSLVVALMAETAGSRLETFTAGFTDPRLDESPWAARVAQHLGVQHAVLRLDAGALEAVPDLVYSLDEPVADRAALPTFLLSRFARERVKVVLTGEGADELFAGYPRYRLEQWAERFHRLPLAERRGLWRQVVALAPAPLRARLAKLLLSPADPGARRREWVSNFTPEAREALIGPGEAPAPQPAPGLDGQLLLDLKTWLVDNVLMKVDKTTMAASLEARVPFLDHEIVDWALALPASAKLHGGVGKAVVKQAAEAWLPREVIHRQKQAFHTPTALWFRERAGRAWLGDVLLGERARARGLVQPGAVERLMSEHQAGVDRDQALWNLLVLELWAQAYLDRVPAPLSR